MGQIKTKTIPRSLQNLGHITRIDNRRPTKLAILGWHPLLEAIVNQKTRSRKTVQYYRKIINEAGLDPSDMERLTTYSKDWRIVKSRMDHVVDWEERKRNHEEPDQRPIEEIKGWEEIPSARNAGKVCLSAGGLVIHQKRIHRPEAETKNSTASNPKENSKPKMRNSTTMKSAAAEKTKEQKEKNAAYVKKAN